MRWLVSILAVLSCSAPLAGQAAAGKQALPCPLPLASPHCGVSDKEWKRGKEAFARGRKLLAEGRMADAYDEFQEAARLVPRDVEYLTTREVTRQQLVLQHLERGNTRLLAKQQVEALAEFRAALQLDAENEFARQRMRDALGEWAPTEGLRRPQIVAESGEIGLKPRLGRQEFHFRGDSRALLEEVAHAFGVAAVVDESVPSRPVRFTIDAVDFSTALQAAMQLTKSFWAPVAENQIVVASDTPENHRQYDRMALRTFYLPDVSTAQELTEIVNVLRTLFEIRFVTPQPSTSTLAVRAPQRMLDAATRFLDSLDAGRPQVLLDFKVFQISHTLVRDMGLDLPARFNMFNIPAGALALLGNQNIQDLINQLIASGGINQANSTAVSALLAQLQNQQNSIFSQPFATFGGGITLFGLSLPSIGAKLSLNESSVHSLEHATLRAAQGSLATFRLGERFPILNASFAPVFNTRAIAQVIQNNSFLAPFPSFSYEDLGLTLKAKPQIHGTSDVTLELEMEIRSLGGQNVNGVPIITNREYKGTITVPEGEPAVVAGMITRSEQKSLSGIPGFAQLPGLKSLTASHDKQQAEDELLVVITAHVLSTPERARAAEVWLPPAK